MQKARLSRTLNIARNMSTREVLVANRAFSFEKFIFFEFHQVSPL